MGPEPEQIIVPKENAVFWLDKNGVWHNEHGRLEHPKIIRYFHKSIQKDENGYHLCQTRDGFLEKVYFPHEDTALFVFDLKRKETSLVLILNTGNTLDLDPEQLFSKNDQLYLRTPDHLVKFAPDALVKLSRFMGDDEDRLTLCLDEKTFIIPEE